VNGKANVCSPETAQRINEAISELNYVTRRRAPAAGNSNGTGNQTAVPLPRTHNAGDLSDATSSRTWEDAGRTVVAPRLPARLRSLGMAIPHSGDLIIPDGADVSSQYADLSTSSQLADQVWQGAARMADYEDYSLFGFPSSVRDAVDPAVFIESGIAGLIVAARHADSRPARLADAGLPVVLIGSVPEIPRGCGAVYPAESELVDIALTYLWGLGHRRIAYVAGSVASDPTVKRMAGNAPTSRAVGAEPATTPGLGGYPFEAVIHRIEKVRAWLRDHGAFDPSLLWIGSQAWHTDVETEDQHVENAVNSWLSMTNPPTAAFCASDAMALRLIAAIQARGLSVPDDFSIIGVGDSTASRNSPLVTPFGGLTSVCLPGEQIGREAVRMLLRLIEGVVSANTRLAVPTSQIAQRGSAKAIMV